MAAKTTPLANAVLNKVLKNDSGGGPGGSWSASVYVALFTSTGPGTTGAATNEVVTAGGTLYARQNVPPANWGTVSSGSVSNSVAVTFPTAGNNWGTVTYTGICSAGTAAAADVLYEGALGTSKTVGTGDQVSFAINALTVTET